MPGLCCRGDGAINKEWEVRWLVWLGIFLHVFGVFLMATICQCWRSIAAINYALPENRIVPQAM